MSGRIVLEAGNGAHTGDGEAKGVRVVRKETLEDRRFTGARGTRNNDWAVGSGRYQIASSTTTNVAHQDRIREEDRT